MSNQPTGSAAYPADYRQWSEKIDRVDVVFAEHINSLQHELYATQAFIGIRPEFPLPEFGTVAAKMNNINTRLAELEKGFATLPKGMTPEDEQKIKNWVSENFYDKNQINYLFAILKSAVHSRYGGRLRVEKKTQQFRWDSPIGANSSRTSTVALSGWSNIGNDYFWHEVVDESTYVTDGSGASRTIRLYQEGANTLKVNVRLRGPFPYGHHVTLHIYHLWWQHDPDGGW